MADDTMHLLDVVQKGDDGDVLKAIAETALQRIMDADVDNIIGAARHERSPERLTWRNGYRERTLETRLGSLEPRLSRHSHPVGAQHSSCPTRRHDQS